MILFVIIESKKQSTSWKIVILLLVWLTTGLQAWGIFLSHKTLLGS
ncbi:Uncharacterised protein [Mycobacteroides abscessus subsp. abscessus]|nr:Uncharacterised protein [Mycobacteroides abscessus subsp. abscessus]